MFFIETHLKYKEVIIIIHLIMEKNMDIFKNLPFDLANKCISYTGKLSYRNGKYINRIDEYDERYDLLYDLPQPTFWENHSTNCIMVELSRMYLRYNINKSRDLKSLNILNKSTRRQTYYVLDMNNYWKKKVLYLM
jgi:hypothetical protein